MSKPKRKAPQLPAPGSGDVRPYLIFRNDEDRAPQTVEEMRQALRNIPAIGAGGGAMENPETGRSTRPDLGIHLHNRRPRSPGSRRTRARGKPPNNMPGE